MGGGVAQGRAEGRNPSSLFARPYDSRLVGAIKAH